MNEINRKPLNGLQFKDKSKMKKKVLIYGEDGTGKSVYAEKYCKQNKLNPVCIDVENTNFTDIPIVDIDLANDKMATRNIVRTIEQVKESDFDTLIIDGVSTLLELLVSNSKGLAKYSDRATSFQKILSACLNSGLNIIFIGQIDMKVIQTDEHQSNKQIIKINALVNEKYRCFKQGNEYKVETEKFRR